MYRIRTVRPEELDRVWALVQAAVAHMNAGGSFQWGEDYPAREDFAAALAAGELYAACGEADAILGVVVLNTWEEPVYSTLEDWRVPGPALVIHKMAVDPAVQGKGVAGALFTFAVGLAAERGLRSLRGDTYTENETMQHLFRRFGFRQVGHVHFPGRPLPFPVYEKVLGEIHF